MTFFFDQDVPDDVGYGLVVLQHQVIRLREVLSPAASDEDVLQYARSKSWVLITCNRDDFLSLAKSKGHSGLIVLIRRRTRAAERAALIRLIDMAGESGIVNNINFA